MLYEELIKVEVNLIDVAPWLRTLLTFANFSLDFDERGILSCGSRAFYHTADVSFFFSFRGTGLFKASNVVSLGLHSSRSYYCTRILIFGFFFIRFVPTHWKIK